MNFISALFVNRGSFWSGPEDLSQYNHFGNLNLSVISRGMRSSNEFPWQYRLQGGVTYFVHNKSLRPRQPDAGTVISVLLNPWLRRFRGQGGVSLTFREPSKIFSRNLCIAEIVLLMRILSWNFVRVPKAMLWHVYKFSAWNMICGIVYFREIILESLWHVSEATPITSVQQCCRSGDHYLSYYPGALSVD